MSIGSFHVEQFYTPKGINLELLPSHQAVGNPEVGNQLDRFYESYRKSLVHLYM